MRVLSVTPHPQIIAAGGLRFALDQHERHERRQKGGTAVQGALQRRLVVARRHGRTGDVLRLDEQTSTFRISARSRRIQVISGDFGEILARPVESASFVETPSSH